MKPRGWDVASDVVNIVKGRNALRTPHRDGQPEDYDGSRAIQPPRKDKPRPSAPRPAPAHSNSAPSSHDYRAEASPGGYAGPGQQWPLAHATQDSYPSYHDPFQAPQGYSSGQNTYRPSHDGYQAPVQQSQYQQQHDHNPLNYQNANQYGQSSTPRPEPDPGYQGQYNHTTMNSGVQNQDLHSNYYGSTSHGQGQAYSQYPQSSSQYPQSSSQYPQSSSSDPRSFGGAATVPPDNAG